MAEKPLSILAIDDNQDILFTLMAIGETFGWKIHAESDSKLAVERVRKLEPDLILIDYHMPGQDGLSTLRQIRSQNRGVPIIVLEDDIVLDPRLPEVLQALPALACLRKRQGTSPAGRPLPWQGGVAGAAQVAAVGAGLAADHATQGE